MLRRSLRGRVCVAAALAALANVAPVVGAEPRSAPPAASRQTVHPTAVAGRASPIRGNSGSVVAAHGVPRAASAAATAAPHVVPRRAAAVPVLGGPAHYDAAKGAVIGANLMGHKR
jgi:hypothetical protein